MAPSLCSPARNGTHQRAPPFEKIVGLSRPNSSAHGPISLSRSKGDDLARNPATRSFEAATGALPVVDSPSCGAVEAVTTTWFLCSSSSQVVTDNTSNVSATNLAHTLLRLAWSFILARPSENSVQMRTESCWDLAKCRPTKARMRCRSRSERSSIPSPAMPRRVTKTVSWKLWPPPKRLTTLARIPTINKYPPTMKTVRDDRKRALEGYKSISAKPVRTYPTTSKKQPITSALDSISNQ